MFYVQSYLSPVHSIYSRLTLSLSLFSDLDFIREAEESAIVVQLSLQLVAPNRRSQECLSVLPQRMVVSRHQTSATFKQHQ